MKIGFIGCGNMASAIIGGVLKNGLVKKEDMYASDKMQAATDKAKAAFGIHIGDNCFVASCVDVLVMAVKPQYMEDAIDEIADSVKNNTIVVTLAPGKTLKWLDHIFGKPTKLVRTMPNTPALVGEGMSALCPNELVTPDELEMVKNIFCSFGKCEVVNESLMDVVVGISGSSPAYAFLFIEALADAAVAEGMPRAKAYAFAAQALLGSAKMVLETGKHPGELKDMVCSPAGTTIEAVGVLEEKGFRSAVIEATRKCIEKSRNL